LSAAELRGAAALATAASRMRQRKLMRSCIVRLHTQERRILQMRSMSLYGRLERLA
jgi:hypothetical protein